MNYERSAALRGAMEHVAEAQDKTSGNHIYRQTHALNAIANALIAIADVLETQQDLASDA